MRRMVEGAGGGLGLRQARLSGSFGTGKRLGLPPSTALQAVPLPRWGRNQGALLLAAPHNEA
jgi:hypothetical protein